MLISSFSPSPDVLFEGFCFAGPDLICSEAGALAYERVQGRRLSSGLDGCYAVARAAGDGWEIGTDHMGLARIFTYEKDNVWAAGTSFQQLADHLRRNGVSIEPDLVTLAALSVRNSLTNQLTSRQTVLRGIDLLPSYQRLRVTADGLHRIMIEQPETLSYQEELAAHLDTWRARLLTIVSDEDSTLSADLTPNPDSRTVFSLLSSIGIGTMGPDRLRVGAARLEDDDVPHRIAERCAVSLNGPALPRRTRINSRRALDSWHAHSLGTYMPVYFQEQQPDPWSFQAHTASGGSLRSPFGAGRGPQSLSRFRSEFQDPDLFRRWSERVASDLEEYQRVRPDIAAEAMHYRQFRVRLHFGHRPHSKSMIMPLMSKGMEHLRLAAPEAPDEQVLLDMMESLQPGIGEIPFRGIKRPLQEKLLARVTRVDQRRQTASGAIYAEQPSLTAGTSPDSPPAAQRWADEVESALRRPEVLEIIGEETASTARNGIAAIQKQQSKLNAQWPGFLAMSYALTVDFVLRS